MNNSALRIVRQGGLTALLALAACAQYPNGTVPTVETITMSSAVQEAAKHYPPLFLGGNVRPSDGSIPLSCPKAGGVVEQRGGPTMEYFGADPSDPDLCVMRVGGEMVKAWYGIWVTAWPGAENARPALRQIFHGKTGDVTGFDTNMMVGLQFHDLIRNEGVEDIPLLGQTYHAVKISHYREGFDGNDYRSVSTVWKDVPTGLLIYGTYQHISGAPVVDDPLGPTRITAGQ